MAAQGIEAAVDAVELSLTANYVAKVAAINTRHSDFDILTIAEFDKSEVPNMEKFPRLETIGIREEVTGEQAGTVHMRYLLSCTVWIYEDAGDVKLRQHVYRHGVAMLELLRAWQAADANYSLHWSAPALEYAAFINVNQNRVLAGVGANFFADRWETL